MGCGIVDAGLDAGSVYVLTNLVATFLVAVKQDGRQDVVAHELGVVGKGNHHTFNLAQAVHILLAHLDAGL